MYVKKTSDLNLTFYKKDISKLRSGQAIIGKTGELEIKVKVDRTDRNQWFECRRVATIQEVLPFSEYDLFLFGIEKIKYIHGYNISLKRDLFDRWVDDEEKEPNSESVTNPFWGRGIQFGISEIDRIHIMYDPTVL